MSTALKQGLFDELNSLTLIDPHTHINPLQPTSQTLADILGYHYYTQLAQSAGMPRRLLEDPGLDSAAKVERLVDGLQQLDNTTQLQWLLEASRNCLASTWIDWIAATGVRTTRLPRVWPSRTGKTKCCGCRICRASF